MRHFFIITFLFFQVVLSYGQITNDELSFFSYSYDKDILKRNKVKTVTIEMFLKDGRNYGKLTFQFDEEGLLKKELIEDNKGNIIREFYFHSNSHNDLISRIKKDYEYDRIDTVRYFKHYENNNLIKDSSSEIPISYNYEYNIQGKLTKTIIKTYFGPGNYTQRVIINNFDNLGRISNSKETVFQNEKDSTGTVFSDRDFFYSKDSKLEKEVEKINSENSWMANKGSTQYIYDITGNMTNLIRTNAASYTYTYDENGLILTKKMNLKTEPDAFDDKRINLETFEKYIYTFRQ